MCDVDHALCSICCKSGYKLRKWCRAGKKAKQMCNLSFCVAHKVSEKEWVCGRCGHTRQRREAKDMLEKEERMKRLERMEKVRRAMEARTEKMEEVGTPMKARRGTADVRKGSDIKKAMEIGRFVNEEGKESRADSECCGGGGGLMND